MQNFDIASLSRTGGRKANEDYADFLQTPASSCWVLADGLGGHRGGATASKTVVEAALASFRERPDVSEDAVTQHVTRAQDALLAAQQVEPSLSQMRSTIVVLVSTDREAVWGHIGDSRLYYVRGGIIALRTRDHSVSQALVDGGQIEPHEQGAHEDRSRLLRCLGKEGELGMTIASPQPLCRGDAFLLCTDGFWESVDDLAMELDFAGSEDVTAWLDRMEARLRRQPVTSTAHARARDAQDAQDAEGAGSTGTKDNYTATAIRLLNESAPLPPPHDPSHPPVASWRQDAASSLASASGADTSSSAGLAALLLPLLRSQPWIATVAAAVLIVALAAGVWQRQRIGRWMTSLWTQAAPKQAGKHDGPTPRDDKGKRDAEQPEPEATPRHGGKAAGEPAAPPASSKAPAKGAGGSDAKGNSASASSPVQSDPPSGATGAQPAGSGRVAAPPSSSTAPTSSSAAPSAPAPPSGGSTTSTTTTAATKKYGTPEAVPAQTVYRPAKGLTYTSLQEAIQHAEPREQIWLGPGDFTEAIAPIKKALVLRGAGRDATRIDLSGHNGLVFSGASGGLEDLDLCCAAGDAVLTIDGAFRGTLTRLRVRIGDGWGIVINGTAAAEIVDVTFEGTGKGTVSVRPAAAARAGR